MTQPPICSVDADKLTLSIKGEPHTYSNDKAGKRQAILDGLHAIPTISVGQDTYLSSSEALQLVAAVMYPEGIQTEEAYQTVCQVTEKACNHIGYGGEVELGPPAVAFARRGVYRRQYPPVDAQLVRDQLNLAGTGSSFPRQEVACTILWNKAGLATYGRHWSNMTAVEQSLIQTQVDAIVEQAGWEKEKTTATGSYTKPLSVAEAPARSRLDELLRREKGRPVLVSSVIYQAQLGAYGRGFYSNELTPALQTIVAETLQAHGYRPTPQDGEYRPLPVTLAAEAETNLQEKLAALPPVMTEFGQALLLRNVVDALGVASISEWQAEQLVADGRVSQALRKVGYQRELTWCQPYHFQPKHEGHDARCVILKEVRIKNDPTRKLSLAQGLAVLTPALAIDDVENSLVYLEMVGAKESVKANWAALMGGNRVHWVGGKRIEMDGMKQHIKLQATLPCGWVSQVLLHKQASLKIGRASCRERV